MQNRCKNKAQNPPKEAGLGRKKSGKNGQKWGNKWGTVGFIKNITHLLSNTYTDKKLTTSRLFNVWHTNPMRFYDIPSGLANAGSGARLCKRRQRWTG
jgi:hypothetical protein